MCGITNVCVGGTGVWGAQVWGAQVYGRAQEWEAQVCGKHRCGGQRCVCVGNQYHLEREMCGFINSGVLQSIETFLCSEFYGMNLLKPFPLGNILLVVAGQFFLPL